ncbi:DUF2059 domain-containing protein [Magnetospira sp. QH-2]|uniref:DUF2059 domain-containing protein n=1 Tax=Magnetospira sp. (strain QH-2) TaxID=1288970 RepID=UPI0003E81858|nr:DUF2059 domain-containing protein [Magnetospira sp. QH-2]CCQ75439.1 exported protein of unknown function [Magnetospira sp. QH-2]
MRGLVFGLVVAACLIAPGTKAAELDADQAARDLMRITEMDKMIEQMFDQLPEMLIQSVKQRDPSADEKKLQAFSEELTAAMKPLIPDLMNQTKSLVSKYFDAGEIQQMIAFYQTPLGKKYVQVMPKMTQESVLLAQQFMAQSMPTIMEQVTAGMEKRGYPPH